MTHFSFPAVTFQELEHAILPGPVNNGTRIEANKGSNCFYNLQASPSWPWSSLFILGALVDFLIDIGIMVPLYHNCFCFHTQNSDDSIC